MTKTFPREVPLGEWRSGKLGLSLVQSPAGYLVVANEPTADTPAARGGVLRGDVLLRVAGTSFGPEDQTTRPRLNSAAANQAEAAADEASANVAADTSAGPAAGDPRGGKAEDGGAVRRALLLLAAQRGAQAPWSCVVLTPSTPALRKRYYGADDGGATGAAPHPRPSAPSGRPVLLAAAVAVAVAAATAAAVAGAPRLGLRVDFASGTGAGFSFGGPRAGAAAAAGGGGGRKAGPSQWRECGYSLSPSLGAAGTAAKRVPRLRTVGAAEAAVAAGLGAELRLRRRPAVIEAGPGSPAAAWPAVAASSARQWTKAYLLRTLGDARFDVYARRRPEPAARDRGLDAAAAELASAGARDADANRRNATFSWWSPSRALGRELGIGLPGEQQHGFRYVSVRSLLQHFEREAAGGRGAGAGADEDAQLDGQHLYMNVGLNDPQLAAIAGDVDFSALVGSSASAAAAASVPDGKAAPPRTNLWLGGRTAYATHYDTSHNFLVQLHGTKRVELWPPHAWRRIRPFPFHHPAFGAAQARGSELPPAAVEAVLKPGDVLYLPPYWWHRVECVAPGEGGYCLSVNAWSARREAGMMAMVRKHVPREELRARPAAVRAFVDKLVERLLPPAAQATFVRDALLRARYGYPRRRGAGTAGEHGARGGALAAPRLHEQLNCSAAAAQTCEQGAGGQLSYMDVIFVEKAERAASLVAREGFEVALAPLRGCRGEGCCNVDAGVAEVVLADLVEEVVVEALGVRSACAFMRACFDVPDDDAGGKGKGAAASKPAPAAP
eukprot:g2979.t1